ncbi:endo-1,4-beta-xylanase [Nesterenkonia ebinurensis]|uniref:endo-1,4-beta-xylanase n=1 Tax=Nesterenkonia ebinurensis TaxID=2608252 RepID=UPI00123CE0B7|nr:endo-1,4-beta-xylanase [Nesterenkonia ebinurensis]
MTSLFTPPEKVHAFDPELHHRRATAQLTLTNQHGEPLTDREVTIAQTRHQFQFGCIGFQLIDWANGASQDPEYDAALAEHWLGLFDTATLPFYWGRFEPQEGEPRTDELRNTARWFAEQGVRIKGHPLVWHTVCAPWLLGKPLDEVERLLRARIRREVSDFAGLIDTWDAINEVVIMPVFTAEDNAVTCLARIKGRVEMMRIAFEEARAANPNATLLLNDFNMSTAYECLIEATLEAGIRIDRLGLQSHMHQGPWGQEKTERVLERFSRYNIPIHFTETTILSGEPAPRDIGDINELHAEPGEWPSTDEGEQFQADALEDHYRRLFEHSAVEALTYWGFPDRDVWLNAPAGLIRRDGTPKPAYHRLRKLFRSEWWTSEATLRTDEQGRASFTGFLGKYRVTVQGRNAEVSLDRAESGDQLQRLTVQMSNQ